MLRTTGTLISAILFSRFTFYARHGKLPAAEQLQSRLTAPGAQEYLVLNLKRRIAHVTSSHNANALDFDQRPGSNGIAAYHLEAERERLRNHGREFAYLKFNLINALKPVFFRLIDDDLEQAFGNGEFVQTAPSQFCSGSCAVVR